MKYHEHLFLGVKTDDMKLARKHCEMLIGAPLKCTNSTFYGGDHCHALVDGTDYDLRLNHHDDGDGWSWCVNDQRYPLVLSCSFRSWEKKVRLFRRLADFDLIEVPADYDPPEGYAI